MDDTTIDKVVQYTKQMIDAAMPIARRAYEIGLVTLRIDAAQGILVGVLLMVFSILVVRKVRRDWLVAEATYKLPGKRSYANGPSDYLPANGVPHCFATLGAGIAGLVSATLLLNVWLWVKLVSPELWLAHRAIEKIIG